MRTGGTVEFGPLRGWISDHAPVSRRVVFRRPCYCGSPSELFAAGFAGAKRPPRTAIAEASFLPKNKRGQCLAGLRYFFFFLAGFFAAFFVAIGSSSLWTFSLGRCLWTAIAALHVARAVCLTQDIAVTEPECQQVFSKKVLRRRRFGDLGKICAPLAQSNVGCSG